jgi:hypothetical protein
MSVGKVSSIKWVLETPKSVFAFSENLGLSFLDYNFCPLMDYLSNLYRVAFGRS